MTISIIIPTIGRASLEKAIMSYIGQVEPGDEIIVVGDGPQLVAEEIVSHIHMDMPPETELLYMEIEPTHHFGAEQIDEGISLAKGDIIVLCGDDDCGSHDALAIIRAAVKEHPYCVHLFRYKAPDHESGLGSISSGQQVAVPYYLAGSVPYADDVGGANDVTWMNKVIEASEREPIAHEEIISIIDGAL